MARIDPANVDLGIFPDRNKIINGDFDVWQRGTSFPSIGGGELAADRWKYLKGGTGTSMQHQILQDTDVPTVAQSGHLSKYSLKVDCTGIDSSITADNYTNILYTMEGYDFKDLAQKAFTISFWVKATKTGTYCLAVASKSVSRSYVAEFTVNVSDTWEKKTITVSASPPDGTWDYENDVGLFVMWSLAMGSDFQTGTTETWQSGDFRATSNQVNACDSESNNFWLSQVQVEPGEEATDFHTRLYQQELALCQRYYEILAKIGWAQYGYAPSAVYMVAPIEHSIEKRTTPTIAVVGSWLTSNCATPILYQTGTRYTTLQAACTGAGWTYFQPSLSTDKVTADAEL